MPWLFAILLSCLGVELFCRLPFTRLLVQMARDGGHAGRIVASRQISEHWKQRVMPVYTRRLARLTLALLACIAVVAFIVLATLGAMVRVSPDAAAFLETPVGIAASLHFAMLHVIGRYGLVHA